MTPKSSDVATTDTADSAVDAWGGYATFDALAEGADSTASRDVYTSADDKDKLIGVPFVITSIVFRPSDKKQDGDYVSCEATTRDNAQIVVNDGSTGIRRQVAQYGEFKGWWKIPELDASTTSDIKSKYDLGVHLWEFTKGDVESRYTEDGSGDLTVTVKSRVQLLAKKGLRRSDYDGPAGKATTFYLA